MNKQLKKMLDKEFLDILNSDRAKRSIETAIRVLETVEKFEEKTCPYATNEISAIKIAREALESLQFEEGC